VGGTQTGRYSFLGSRPTMEVMAKEGACSVLDHERGERTRSEVGPGRYCLPRHMMPCVDEVTGNGPGRPGSPRHGVPFKTINADSKRESMVEDVASYRCQSLDQGGGSAQDCEPHRGAVDAVPDRGSARVLHRGLGRPHGVRHRAIPVPQQAAV